MIVLLWQYFFPLNSQSILLALIEHTASCNIIISDSIISLQSALYLAGNQRWGMSRWMEIDGWMDEWQWRKKSKLYTQVTLCSRSVFLSKWVMRCMDKRMPTHDKHDFHGTLPRNIIVAILSSFLGLRKWKNLGLWPSRDLSILFYNHPLHQRFNSCGSGEALGFC